MKQIFIIFAFVFLSFISGMVYCYYNYQFWTYLRTDNFEALIEYRGENIDGYRGRQILIHKNFEPYMIKIDKYAAKNNIELIINQSYRPEKKTPSGTIVKPAKFSNHIAGFAIDFNVKYNGEIYFSNEIRRKNLSKLPKDIQTFFKNIRQDKDLRWGGDFWRQDPIHIDYPINMKNKKGWIEYSRLCNKDYSNGTLKWKIWKIWKAVKRNTKNIVHVAYRAYNRVDSKKQI